jgi:DNA-binding beta-propeller fold protein YncE
VQQPDGTMLVTDNIIADFGGSGSSGGSLRGVALDERNNRLYVTDYGESELLGPLCYILLATLFLMG